MNRSPKSASLGGALFLDIRMESVKHGPEIRMVDLIDQGTRLAAVVRK